MNPHIHWYPIGRAISLVFGIVIGLNYPPIVTAQDLLPLMERPMVLPERGISFGVDKLANTFTFTGNADVLAPFQSLSGNDQLGWIRFTNVYTGTIYRTSAAAVRDDEQAQFSLNLPFSGSETGHTVSGIARGAWVLSQDSRSIGLSSLNRGAGALGLRVGEQNDVVAENNRWQMEAFAGLETTTQLGIEATGPLFGGSASVNRMDLGQWSLDGKSIFGWHKSDAARTNRDVDLRVDIRGVTEDGSGLTFGAGGSTLGRQYFTTITGSTSPLAIENRNETRIGTDYNLDYNFTDKLSFISIGQLQVNTIRRSYGEAIGTVPITSVNRTLGEFVIDIEGRMSMKFNQANVMAGGSVFFRDESNTVAPVDSIDESDLVSLRSQESQRDNTTSRVKMFAKALWNPVQSDTLTAEWTWWLLKYDTPSDINNDDRDELAALATLRYSHSISELLTLGVALSGQYVHTVFLRASNSGQNNENNVIRLSPFVYIKGSVVTMKPTFEVLANYTVYDFEGQGALVRSYGLRRITYRDSIHIKLTPSMDFEIPSVVQYFETSTLVWDKFSEIPSSGTLEYVTKFLIFSRSHPAWEVGAGIRLYAFERRRLVVIPGESAITGAVQSWAPEVDIRYSPLSGSTLILSGWYEFQTLTPYKKIELPRLVLQARIAL